MPYPKIPKLAYPFTVRDGTVVVVEHLDEHGFPYIVWWGPAA